MKTLLEIVTEVCDEVGLDQPSAVITNTTDPNVRKLLRFAQKAGETISRRHDWQVLSVLHTWTSIAAEIQTSGPPSQADYDHLNTGAVLWDRTNNRRWSGPSSSNRWQAIQNSIGAAGNMDGYWRIVGGTLHMYPDPSAGKTLDLPYQSSKWAASSGGAAQFKFLADTDVPRIPDHLFVLDMIGRWKHSAGLGYAEDMSDFERALELATSRDAGIQAIVVARPRDPSIHNVASVPSQEEPLLLEDD